MLVPLVQAQLPQGHAGYVKELPGIGGDGHGSLLITLPGVLQGPGSRFSSSFSSIRKGQFQPG